MSTNTFKRHVFTFGMQRLQKVQQILITLNDFFFTFYVWGINMPPRNSMMPSSAHTDRSQLKIGTICEELVITNNDQIVSYQYSNHFISEDIICILKDDPQRLKPVNLTLNYYKSMIAEEVQYITIEPARIAHAENIARRTYKIVNWLKVISMHRDNRNYAQVDSIIRDEVHENFVMQEGFWENEISVKFAKPTVSQEDIHFLMLALDDGPYFGAAATIAKRVLKQFSHDSKKHNFTLSILEKMVNLFSYDKKNGSQFYQYLRSAYEKTGNPKKIRECFEREIKQAFDDFDMAYDSYKMWEKDDSNLEKFKKVYEEAKEKWQAETIDFDEERVSKLNIRRSLFQLEYKSVMQEKEMAEWLSLLPTEAEKLWFLRRWVLNYRQMIPYYLTKCQQFYASDEEKLITKYKVAIRLSQSNPKIQEKYIYYLSRRINKHLTTPDLLQDDYSSKWGQKVVFLREEINNLISKERKLVTPAEQENIYNRYYKLLIEIEQNIIKDKETICKLYENLIKNQKETQKDLSQCYVNYANSLVQLNSFKDAKNVLKRYHYHAKSQQSRNTFLKFIGIYGTIDDEIQFTTEQRNQLTKKIELMALSKPSEAIELQVPKEKTQTISNNQPQPNHKVTQNNNIQSIEAPKRERTKQFDAVQDKIESSMRKKLHVDGDSTIFMKGIPTNWTQSDVLNVLTSPSHVNSVRLVVKYGVQKEYCYIQFDSKEAAEDQVSNNKSGYSLKISKPPADYDESKTLFVCALPQTATKEKIEKLFSASAEHIIDIRLKLDHDKNYAYVEFDTQENKDIAFSEAHHQSLVIDGKKILVQQCDSSRQKNKKFAQVVFLKSLTFKATEKDVENFFNGMKIANLMIPKDQAGKRKGFGYVEFEKFKDYQGALDMKKGVLFGRQFQILKSDRQITVQNPQKSEPEDHSEKAHKQKEKSRPNNKRRQTDGSIEEQGNNYFSNLFK